MEKEFYKTIDKLVNEYESDICGFKEMIYKSYPKYYRELKQKYGDDLLKNTNYKVDIKLELVAKGNILKEIANE